MYRVGVIGTGVVGSALTLLLYEKGYIITGVYSVTGTSAARLAAQIGCLHTDSPEDILPAAEVIFLTTPDRELGGLAARLAQAGHELSGKTFFHMSGAFPAEELEPLRRAGAFIGSLHPLQSFASVQMAVTNLPGSFYALQGDREALEIARHIVRDLQGKSFVIRKEDKPLYHMGAAVASNYLVAVIDFAVKIFESIGISAEEAIEALLPLIKGTLSNIEKLGPVKALTGPIARGDAKTVRGHLEAAGGLEPELTDLYRALGRYTVGVALRKGTIDATQAEKLKSILRKDDD